jgi:C-terminal processing protease CtpA/Prc
MSVADFQPVPASLRRLGTAIAYVELPGTAWTPEVEGRIRETASARGDAAPCGWIVDLRRNPGGSVPAIFDVLRPLLGPEPFGAFVSSTGQSTPWTRQQPDGDQAAETSVGPVAILTSRLTAGAGETAVLAFRGRPNGPTAVIGEATWGLGTGTTDFAMPDGATLQLLTRREMDRTGRLQVGPVAPDILAPTDWARFATPDDPTLSAAIQWQNDNGCRVPAR